MENFQHAVFGDGAQRDDHLISSDGGLLEGYTLVSRSFCSFSHLITPHNGRLRSGSVAVRGQWWWRRIRKTAL
jgi:hypothetical protein